ncbi:hypothetical protein TWF718_003571 [Orbilia javanica]|uniref:Rhodopsin domain-containing protein n=1 Tax=Orbilia javanica TaxID=47235 RepID=A0AAN8RKB2_9PEZI
MSDSEDVVFDAETILIILSASLWVGAGSPKYSHLRTLAVMKKYAAFFTAANYTFTPEDLTKNFGTRPSDAPLFIDRMGGEETMMGNILQIVEFEAYLPHPRNDGIVLPLFIALTVMTTLAVALRMWSRYKVAGSIQSFDYITVAAYLMTVAWGGIAVYHSNSNGVWAAFYDMSWDTLRENYQITFILNVLYPWAMLLIKISLCVFYYQMTTMKWIRWGCLATAFITFGNTIAGFFIPIFSCRPTNYWDHLFVDPCKIDRRTASIAVGAIYILTDVATWALPMPLIFHLPLSMKQRILALCTFGIGAVACVASGFRLEAVIKFTKYSSQSSSTLLIDAWTIIEMNIALLCACAPAVRALVMYYVPKMFPNFGAPATKNSTQDTKGTETAKTQPATKVTPTNGNEKA